MKFNDVMGVQKSQNNGKRVVVHLLFKLVNMPLQVPQTYALGLG